MRIRPAEFHSVAERRVQGRGFTSTAQRDYLQSRNPDLASNMERYTSQTAFLPARAQKRRKRR